MRRSRAGRTGGSWYGAYEVWYVDADGVERRHDVTSRRLGECRVRDLVRSGAAWAELRGDPAGSRAGTVLLRREREQPGKASRS